MKNEARRHHYISQFYLRGFGKSGPKNPPITVINLRDKKYFITTSNNLASIRDFNRINVPNLKADTVETAYQTSNIKLLLQYVRFTKQKHLKVKIAH